MEMLSPVPHGKREIIETYGTPDANGDGVLDQEWFEKNIRIFDMPFSMRLSWRPTAWVTRFQAHRFVGKVIYDALSEIAEYRGLTYLQTRGYDMFGGCFNFRFAKGDPRALSTHAWGIAIDLNPHLAPFGEERHKQPAFIIEAFKRRGFFAGADWPMPYTDGMHFQAATGY